MARPAKEKEAKKIVEVKKETESKNYRAICHTRCFFLNTFWDEGDVYVGTIPPNKHFSKDGAPPNEDPAIRKAGDDPRSTVEMRTTLRKKYGVEIPQADNDGNPIPRKVVFETLRKHELAAKGEGGIKAKK